jgi:putative ABC transport system ATP-binding protein
MRPIIKLTNVWKIYTLGTIEVNAVQDMSMEIKPKDFVIIMGPSGSGKSTAMHLVGCLDTPTKGNIYLDGQNISHLTESELAQIRGQKIGFVFQKFNLLPNLNAIENVVLPMSFQGIDEDTAEDRAISLLKTVGLGERMLHKPSELSGGEQQRVAIARALANDPDIILADEPTGNLDTKTGTMIMKLLVDLHKQKSKTIIVVTHDRDLIKYGDKGKVFNLRDGRIV